MKQRPVKHRVTQELLVKALAEYLTYLENSMPPEHHHWVKPSIERRPNGFMLNPGRPPQFVRRLADIEKEHFVADLISALRSDDRFAAIVNRNRSNMEDGGACWSKVTPEHAIGSFLVEYVYQLTDLSLDLQLAEQCAARFLESLNTGQSHIVCYSFLNGLELKGCESVELVDGITLRKLTDEQMLSRMGYAHTTVQCLEFFNQDCVLETTSSCDVGNTPDFYKFESRFEEMIAALHVLSDGIFTRGVLRIQPLEPCQMHASVIPSQVGNTTWDGHSRKNYTLCANQIADLRQIIAACRYWRSQNRTMSLAIDRITSAARRQRTDDRLIDAVTALEIMFGGGQAISYKIAMRVAVLIGTTYEERVRLKSQIEDVYKWRSSVVHGGSEASKAVDSIANLMRILRRAISQMSIMPKAVRTANQIDDWVLQSVQPPSQDTKAATRDSGSFLSP